MVIEFKHPKIIDALIDPKYRYIFTNTGTKLECWNLLNKKKIDFPILETLIEKKCSKITDLIDLSKDGKFLFVTDKMKINEI
jgi:hypothetical protein